MKYSNLKMLKIDEVVNLEFLWLKMAVSSIEFTCPYHLSSVLSKDLRHMMTWRNMWAAVSFILDTVTIDIQILFYSNHHWTERMQSVVHCWVVPICKREMLHYILVLSMVLLLMLLCSGCVSGRMGRKTQHWRRGEKWLQSTGRFYSHS